MLLSVSMWSPWPWLVMSILYCISRILYNIYLHPLAKFPGPRAWSATRLTWIWSVISGAHHLRVKEIHDRYGPIVRITPDELSFIGPKAASDIYCKKDEDEVPQKNAILFGGLETQHSFMINDENHAQLRRKLSPSFSRQALVDHEPLLQKYLGIMTEKLREASSTGQTINIVEWLNWFSFDIIGELSLSESFGQLDRTQSHPWPALLMSHIKYASLNTCLQFYPLVARLLPLIMSSALKEQFESMAREKVQRRLTRADSKQLKDAMATCLPRTNGEEIMDMDRMTSSFTFLIMAGSETSATTMAGLFNLLCKHPDIRQRLHEELRAVSNAQDLTLATTAEMPYLNAVVKEGLRFCHPVAGALTRVVPPKGKIIAGHFVPGNTYVGVPYYAAYRSEANFSSAGDFNPSRWLGGKEDASQKDINASTPFYPFAMGRNICLGQHLAQAELRLVLAHLFYQFDLDVVEAVRWDDQECYFLWQKQPLIVRLREVMQSRES